MFQRGGDQERLQPFLHKRLNNKICNANKAPSDPNTYWKRNIKYIRRINKMGNGRKMDELQINESVQPL